MRQKGGSVEQFFHELPRQSRWFTTDKPVANGSLFQKWHRSHTCPSTTAVSMTKTDQLRYRMISAFNDGDPGYRFAKLGKLWLEELPRRLGSTPALDDACACVAAAKISMAGKNDPSTWINPALYNRALQSLRLALQSRHEALSTHTLAACAVLYLLEVSLEVLIRI